MTSPAAARLFIQEVATRDGFQIEPRFVPTAEKVALIDALSRTGLAKIEVSSFVSPAAVPNLRDAAEVFARITRNPSVTYVALVPNLRGARAAIAARVDEMNLVMSASETHNRANMRMGCAQSLDGFRAIAEEANGTGVALHGSIATSFGCPFEGYQPPARVLAIVERYLALGLRSVTLADTTGMANPRQVGELVAEAFRQFPGLDLTLHFHNTRGMGLANVLAALGAGAQRFDASLGGLGGCPFAPGATGNICTEDLVHMLDGMGLETGVDLTALIRLSRALPALLGHEVPGQVAKAGRSCDLHPVPDYVQNQ
jgi:hydroxymethylglutaryl-CoA lyase